MSFTQNDIRPVELEAAKTREIERDMQWLVARQAQFVPAACPACAKDDPRPAFDKYGFRFVECPHCRTVYMSPRASPALMAEFYATSKNYEFWDKHVFPASRVVRREKIFRPRVEQLIALLDRLGIAPAVAMDVGASVGIFLEALRETGRFTRMLAVEPNAAQAETCRRLGFETIEADFFSIARFDEPITMITAFEVIEHLYSPRDFLVRCHSLLAPRGIVAISCPNQFGFDIQTLGPQSQSFDVEHVNMFNPAALTGLFSDCGFDVTECITPGELDAQIVREAALAGSVNFDGQPFLKTVLLDRWDELGRPFQQFLKSANLSSSMWVTAVRS